MSHDDNAHGHNPNHFDVVVVGAGFAGMYLLYRLRKMGLSARVIETADEVGGTWYWNRYPGARCDVQTVDYSYSFDPELQDEWEWSERYATQPEILRYAQFVADKHDLRRDIQFTTSVTAARWDEDTSRWEITVADVNGDASMSPSTLTAQHYVMATGCLSMPKDIDIEGIDRFAGATYTTSRWPHEGVDFTGKRVAVVGTGSSGVQSIPIIAEQAEHLTVFQRTPNFSIPARNGPVSQEKLETYQGREAEYREEARWSGAGVPLPVVTERAFSVSEEERQARFETMWQRGELFVTTSTFADIVLNEEANATLAEFIRAKIRETVNDPETAETLCPYDHPFGTKRPCLDSHYYETYNRPNVSLVDLRKTPIATITETGIDTSQQSYEFDVIVFATGFDAMTGAIVAVDITGRDGVKLADKWEDGPRTYLGLTVRGFPNFFAITGPGSPSVLSNMMVSIEQHVDWISDCVDHLRQNGLTTIEPTATAEDGWVQHVNDAASISLFPKANSWYMGANVPGKPRVFLPFVGGVGYYRRVCDEVADRGYLGFEFTANDGATSSNDGVVRRMPPDVTILLETMASLGLPPLQTMTPEEARDFTRAAAAARPDGPEVGEVLDGTFPGADGDLAYRLFRPSTPGPHPIIVYYHGGGWVLGSADSDSPFCRYLAVHSDCLVVSVDYRHAPEHRFPAAADDAIAAAQWVAANAAALGGAPGPLALCGTSAGGNLAGVVARHARDHGGPEIAGQALIVPVASYTPTRPSNQENADGYVLTADLMEWFWDHYTDPSDRDDPKVSLLVGNYAGLPSTLVVTSEFDPLRDDGAAYAQALAEAGVDVRYVNHRGQIHTSITAVDVIRSSEGARAEIAEALRKFLNR